MSIRFGARPSPALIVAMIALVCGMSGAAVALPGRGQVHANDIAKKAVRAKHVARNAVRSKQVKDKTIRGSDLKDDAIGSQQVKPEALSSSDLAGLELADDSLVRVSATEAPASAARETVLYEEGPLTVYAKCFREGAELNGVLYAETRANGALLDGVDKLPAGAGDGLLNVTTPESGRQLAVASVSGLGQAAFESDSGALAAPGGATFTTLATIGVKQGTLIGGDGAFGSGNVCLFGLVAIG